MLGIVLVAGRGRRMGGPKALLQMPNGLPLAWEHARLRSDCTTLLVVVRDLGFSRFVPSVLLLMLILPSFVAT